jgi:lipopolysaccharide export LptBFGC system permease protein LptF
MKVQGRIIKTRSKFWTDKDNNQKNYLQVSIKTINKQIHNVNVYGKNIELLSNKTNAIVVLDVDNLRANKHYSTSKLQKVKWMRFNKKLADLNEKPKNVQPKVVNTKVVRRVNPKNKNILQLVGMFFLGAIF